MAEKIIYIGLTEKEYADVEKAAKKEKMSIPTYCKSRIIDSEFYINYKLLLEKVEELPSKCKFSIHLLWESDENYWNQISRGVRLAMGRQFYSQVSKKVIKNVSENGYGPNGTMYYIKN
ncbi:MAG: single-stranded DNA-binding protein [Treponema sp.]|nr:single-stranded DNA-binding protein [Treponema sp.]